LEKVLEKKQSFAELLATLFTIPLSDKLKFSIKVSLSMVLAYLIPLSQGWAQASTAAITIMLIAAMGSVTESVVKGAMRVVGTVIGAIIGMTLIALFPQDRMLYLLILSVTVAVSLYLARAYKGDPSIFMLTAMTMMMVFKNGEVDDVFIYGLDKTYMTIFGIAVYTFVGVFLWPVSIEESRTKNAQRLSQTQLALFLQRNADTETRDKALEKLLEDETLLQNATMDTGSAAITLEQWHSVVYSYKKMNATLTLLSLHDEESSLTNLDRYVSNYGRLEREVTSLFEEISLAWKNQHSIEIPEELSPEYQSIEIETLTHLQRASLISTTEEMAKLHKTLRSLALKLNRIHSALPTYFEHEKIPEKSRFLWGDIEHLKGVLVTFIIFWAATFFWITMNPLGSFMVVALATGLSMLTTFTPIKPSLLMIVFTFSFIFSTLMYVFVLPQLHYAWELGMFIFVYTFIAFYWLKPEVAIFFLLGLFTLNIGNTMYYEFSIYLLILLMFYLFLTILNLFYYIPFSTKPEHLFLQMKMRFFSFSKYIILLGKKQQEGKKVWGLSILAAYSKMHLMETVKKMQLWGSKIDEVYFDTIEKKKVMAFTKEAEKFAYLVLLLYDRDKKSKENSLLKHLRKAYTLPDFSTLLDAYAKGKDDIDSFWESNEALLERVEETLSKILNDIEMEKYSKKELAQLYEFIALRRNVWVALFSCQKQMEEIDFNRLKESRF